MLWRNGFVLWASIQALFDSNRQWAGMFWADRSPNIGLVEGNLGTMIAFAHVI
jgi:hypothetical protein